MFPVHLHLRSGHLLRQQPSPSAGDHPQASVVGLSFQVIEIELTRPDRLMFPLDLQTLTLPGGINARLGVVLTGRAPIWLYGWLVHECHFTRWVACYDPRLGAVVVSSHSPEVQVGEILPWTEGAWAGQQDLNGCQDAGAVVTTERSFTGGVDSSKLLLAAAVMVVGPPNSGKSRLAHALFQTLLLEHPDIYLQRAHWDGEGNWTLDLPQEQARALKQRYRGRLTPEFFGFHAQAILNLRRQKSLVIVDVGGKVDPHKQPLLEACSHYVLVSRDPEAIPLWQEFCRDRGNLRCLAILHTASPHPLRDLPELEMHWDPAAALPVGLLQRVRSLVGRSY